MVVAPNHQFFTGFSIINHPIWGTPISGNLYMGVPYFPFPSFPHYIPFSKCRRMGQFKQNRLHRGVNNFWRWIQDNSGPSMGDIRTFERITIYSLDIEQFVEHCPFIDDLYIVIDLQTVLFHSYVKLPEGKFRQMKLFCTPKDMTRTLPYLAPLCFHPHIIHSNPFKTH